MLAALRVMSADQLGGDEGLPRAVRKMTAHAELAVRTTLREAFSDGSLRFGEKISAPQTRGSAPARRSRLASQLIAGFVSVSHLYYLVPQPGTSLGIDKHTNSQYIVSILCSIQR